VLNVAFLAAGIDPTQLLASTIRIKLQPDSVLLSAVLLLRQLLHHTAVRSRSQICSNAANQSSINAHTAQNYHCNLQTATCNLQPATCNLQPDKYIWITKSKNCAMWPSDGHLQKMVANLLFTPARLMHSAYPL